MRRRAALRAAPWGFIIGLYSLMISPSFAAALNIRCQQDSPISTIYTFKTSAAVPGQVIDITKRVLTTRSDHSLNIHSVTDDEITTSWQLINDQETRFAISTDFLSMTMFRRFTKPELEQMGFFDRYQQPPQQESRDTYILRAAFICDPQQEFF